MNALPQPQLPLQATAELIAELLDSDEVHAALAVRAEQILVHGHTAESDMEHSLDFLLRQARGRIDDALGWLGHGELLVPAERCDQVLRKLDAATAQLLAARKRIAAAPVRSAEGDRPISPRPEGENHG